VHISLVPLWLRFALLAFFVYWFLERMVKFWLKEQNLVFREHASLIQYKENAIRWLWKILTN
jgi:hypothetical protein